MARRRGREWVLDVLVGLTAVLALSLVVRERVAPWIAERSVVDPGEAIGQPPSLLDPETGDSLPFRGDTANLLLVFRSTCPTCERALPAWNRLAGNGDWTTTAVGLERPGPAAAYAGAHLPAARAAVPSDIREFTRRFRIGVVPTTLLIDRGGHLVARHAGPLEDSDIDAFRRHVEPSAP